ncbi:Na(+)-translocating NADH-quinone reductase subunit A [Flavicella sediminum]|uniref:Na(+)-translocating NADH-quinone reductase subunit A n=1 Tax=Flavicella sediminum TaxID=2585141 RepID=UPI001122BE44|nr:Na(+)-translocating NADH-quinone reductase subunit A [Flavicella sediminum]
MSKDIRIKKGLDIKLKGIAETKVSVAPRSGIFAIQPKDFHGITPKLTVKVGAEVIVGDVLFYSKSNEQIKFTSPVSGTVTEIKRGAKRRILAVVIEAKPKDEFKNFGKKDPNSLTKEEVSASILESGCWPLINQRPYDVIANPADEAKAIFVSSFDTAPLAPNYAFTLKEQEAAFQAGIDALSKLTAGKVYLAVNESKSFFNKVQNAEIVNVTGKHPAGNVGVQISHISPINQGEKVWTVNAQDVAIIGNLFLSGEYKPNRILALAGSEVKAPQYYNVTIGQQLNSLLDGNINADNSRVISGNVLTGDKESAKNGFLGHYDNIVSVIPEGNVYRMFGWIPFIGSGSIHSASKTSFSWLFPNKEYTLNTNLNGEERALVVTGEMEKVMPIDIFPMQLLKAVIANDIEKMENLGIYEVAPEDFALIDYTSSSKIEAQAIIRGGLDLMINEVG